MCLQCSLSRALLCCAALFVASPRTARHCDSLGLSLSATHPASQPASRLTAALHFPPPSLSTRHGQRTDARADGAAASSALHWLSDCTAHSPRLSVRLSVCSLVCVAQKFRFCGEQDAPDWILAEVSVLSKMVRTVDSGVMG